MDYIVGDSGMGMLLTRTNACSRLQDLQAHHPTLNVIELDRAWQDIAQGRPPALSAPHPRAQPGVYDLHLGVHGPAKRGHDPP